MGDDPNLNPGNSSSRLESSSKSKPGTTDTEGDDKDINEENLSETQLEILTLAYNEWPHPFDELVDQLVIETGLEKQGVKNWFWNRTWEKIKTARKKAKKEKARMIREK